MGADWESVQAIYDATIRQLLPRRVDPTSHWFERLLAFELGRLDEGRRIGEFFIAHGVRGAVLDVGGGTGGVCFGLASHPDLRGVWIDLQANSETAIVRKRTGLNVGEVAGSGEALPFADASFDAAVCVETIEHIRDRRALGREIMRVLKPGAPCMVTTPPRARYFFRGDPHYGIPGLLLLPDGLQRFVGSRRLPRKEMYDVQHIYWHVHEVAREFPSPKRVEVLWDRAYSGGRSIRDRLWFRFRYWLWDRIVIWKE